MDWKPGQIADRSGGRAGPRPGAFEWRELPRFEEKALTQAAMDMIREINPKAEVTAVDCTEYPCIVYGTGLTIDQAKSLRRVSAGAAPKRSTPRLRP